MPGSGKLLGEARTTLEAGYSRLPKDRETGLIAGSMGLGLGLFMGGTPVGPVTVRFLWSNHGLQDRMVLTGKPHRLSLRESGEASNFLETGRCRTGWCCLR